MKPFIITEESIAAALAAELHHIELHKIEVSTEAINEPPPIERRMAKYAALGVDFIETAEELRLYTDAIYNAVMWGKKISNPNPLKSESYVC